MRIIDTNYDYYDYLSYQYVDNTFTFDRRDSYVLSKEVFCEKLSASFNAFKRAFNVGDYVFLKLQICHTFWLFLVEITEQPYNRQISNYDITLIASWKNYNSNRTLLSLETITFPFFTLYNIQRRGGKENILTDKNVSEFIELVNSSKYEQLKSFNYFEIRNGDYSKTIKTLPLLGMCGIQEIIPAQDVYQSLEEYFSLEQQSAERRESVGLTDKDKIINHGFDITTSFRTKKE